jgi:16S rRNA (uracil1498-N3)-methyltransferase
MHRCYVPHATDGTVEVVDDQAHHITTVLRLGVGAIVAVFDGRGHEWIGRIASAERARVVITLGEVHVPAAEPPVDITLAIGLLKGDQMSQVVRDATALGVSRVVPFLSQHTAVARPSAWADLRLRWQRVAVSASSQSGRAVVPEIADVMPFDELLHAEQHSLLICVEPGVPEEPNGPGPRPAAATLVVGPEGGWAPEEVDRARTVGARVLSFGPRTLRAELAPVVALSSLWTSWGWR